MSVPRAIRLLAVSLLLCILPCSVHSQIIGDAGIAVPQNVEEDENRDDGKRKIWDKLKFWKEIDFNVFKFKKGQKDSVAIAEPVEPVKKEKGPKMQTQISIGTNLLSWAYFGTANLETSINIGRHLSFFVGGRYNSLEFETKAYKEIFHKQTTGYAGIKWWPWFVNSGWWVGLKGQYSDFSTAGVMSSYQKDGVAVGGGLSGGYSFMLGKHFNLELGAGIWGGTYLEYSNFEKPNDKPGMFVKIDNIQVSFLYYF